VVATPGVIGQSAPTSAAIHVPPRTARTPPVSARAIAPKCRITGPRAIFTPGKAGVKGCQLGSPSAQGREPLRQHLGIKAREPSWTRIRDREFQASAGDEWRRIHTTTTTMRQQGKAQVAGRFRPAFIWLEPSAVAITGRETDTQASPWGGLHNVLICTRSPASLWPNGPPRTSRPGAAMGQSADHGERPAGGRFLLPGRLVCDAVLAGGVALSGWPKAGCHGKGGRSWELQAGTGTSTPRPARNCMARSGSRERRTRSASMPSASCWVTSGIRRSLISAVARGAAPPF